jgi:hypothetical protein
MTRDTFYTACVFICLGLSAYLGEQHGERTGFKAGEAAMYEQNFGNATYDIYGWRKHMAALKVAER